MCEEKLRSTSNISNAQDADSSTLYDAAVVWEKIGSLATCRAHVRRSVRTIRKMTLVVVWAWLTS